MKKMICTLLVLLLLFLAACGGNVKRIDEPAQSTSATAESFFPDSEGTTVTEMSAEASRPSLAWSTAFRSGKVPAGSFLMDEIAFYQINDEDSVTIVNVPKAKIEQFSKDQDTLPRCRYYERFMDSALLELLPILDYALENGYTRFCIPTTSFNGGMITNYSKELTRTYRINDKSIYGFSVTTVEEGDAAYDCVLVSIPELENPKVMKRYKKAIEAAKRIVAEMPKGLNEYERAVYLYEYLTQNVSYNYFVGSEDLLYNALIKKMTVERGFTDALCCLYNLAGIECIAQEGWYVGRDGSATWGEAQIDGEWYLFDPCYDVLKQTDGLEYFGISDAKLQTLSPREVTAYDKETCPSCPRDLLRPVASLNIQRKGLTPT